MRIAMTRQQTRLSSPPDIDAISALFKPKALERYADLTRGGQLTITLNQEQACAVLQAHDYGIENVPPATKLILDNLISDLKQEIWP
jgi:hypothetical protein